MAAILRMKMVQSSNCLAAQSVDIPSLRKVARRDYHSVIVRLMHTSHYGIKPRRLAPCHRHFSQSLVLLTESSQFAEMAPDRLASSRTSMTPYSNNKPSKIEAHFVDNGSQLPKQSSITTRILFQIIAPHIEFRTLTQLTNRLSKIELDPRDRAGKEQSLTKMLDMLFDDDGKTNSDIITTVRYAPSLKAHQWIQPTIHAYFMGKKLDVPKQDRADPPSYQKDQTYPPNRNRQQQQKNLNTLIEARKFCLRHPIKFENGSTRSSDYSVSYNHEHQSHAQLHLEAEGMLEKLALHLPLSHFNNLMEKIRVFAMPDDKLKQNDSNSWYIDNDGDTLSDRHASNDPKAHDTSSNKDNTRILCNALTNCSPSHSHLVANAFADYFGLDLPTLHSTKKEKKAADKAIDKDAKPDINTNKEPVDALKYQREIRMIEKKYEQKRDKFVQDVMELQHIFASWGEHKPAENSVEDHAYQASTIETVLIEKDEDGDDVSSDLLVKEFKKAQEPYSPQTRIEQKEQLKGTLEELRKIGLDKANEGVDKKKGKGRGRPQKGNHIRFTAIRMEEKNESSQHILEGNDSSDKRIVFLNNLPIDITEDEIDAIYSRCGQLDSIQLFNLRPDLDPGPLSTKQLKERLRMKKLMRRKNTYASQGRPRTPVYAMLRFQTDAGYRVATSQELCIFGCVIRRHPVLSIKSHDVNTLYLEQIPPHLFSIDVEQKLGELLYPHQFSLMLDGTHGLGVNGYMKNNENYQEYSRPASCQVRFVDHHAAAQAYQWITKEGGVFKTNNNGTDDVQVHWFQTPSNSMDYWTRDLSF